MAVHIMDLFDATEFGQAIIDGYLDARKHPTAPLTIYTYNRRCQYDRYWNTTTIRCRGLIADDDGYVVAWPFPKFFNVSEHGMGYQHAPDLPDLPFKIFEKIDGSLGIIFHHNGRWNAASKGSFQSDQARWAQAWLDTHDTSALNPEWTYLAEILYPDNRIVVNYHGMEKLVLLAVYNVADGAEVELTDDISIPWIDMGGDSVWAWNNLPLDALMRLAADNTKTDGAPATGTDSEGWVIRYANGTRAKIKYAEYMRLHKIITGINARDIWQAYGTVKFPGMTPKDLGVLLGLSADHARQLLDMPGGALAPLIDNVPDEFDQWMRGVIEDLDFQYDGIINSIRSAYTAIVTQLMEDPETVFDRAKFAEHVKRLNPKVHAGLFRLYDGKDIGPLVWKSLRPTAEAPFKEDADA